MFEKISPIKGLLVPGVLPLVRAASEVYRDALGRVSVAGSPARREPWRAPAVEDGIEARVRAPSLAGSTDAYARRCHPAAPDHARRPPRRGRAAARPHHLHRAAARRRDHPRRPRHRRHPGGRAVALLDHLLLVPAARPLGVARGLAGAARGAAGAVRPAGLARGHRRHRGRAHLRPGPRLAPALQPRRQAEPVAVPARPGLAVPGRGGRARLAGRRGAADAAPGPPRHPPRQARERPLPAAPARPAARPGAAPARRLVHARPADRGRGRRRPYRDRPGAPRPRALRGPAAASAAARTAAQVRPADDAAEGQGAAGPSERPDPLRQAGGGALPHLPGGGPLPEGPGGARGVGGAGAARPARRGGAGEERLLVCTDPDLPAVEVVTSYAKRWSVEPLFAAMKHGWGLKDAWQQSRQVLMRWATILAAGYALGQMLAYTDPARVPGLASPAPWRPPGTRTAGLVRAGLARLLRGVGPAALTPAIARKSGLRSGRPDAGRPP